MNKSSTDNNDKTYSVVAQYDYDAWGGVIWSSGNNERAKYIGKETDAESGDHNHGVRQYSDYVGRFLCPDGLWAKYVGWTPYQYAGNNPINLYDANGFGPGDKFNSKNEAAHDFGTIYNPKSIKENVEFNCSIYKTTEDGEPYYSYSEPAKGTWHTSSPSDNPKGTKRVATAHTHGQYTKDAANDELSNVDMTNSRDYFKVHVYGIFPDGSMWIYDNKKDKAWMVSKDLPCDKKDPKKKNNKVVDPNTNEDDYNKEVKNPLEKKDTSQQK